MTREEAHQLIDEIFNASTGHSITGEVVEAEVVEATAPERVLPEGQRVIRTKNSGDRVYMLDDNKKTRQWITNGDVLTGLGFEFGDVTEVDDNELLKYNMGPAIYRVEA